MNELEQKEMERRAYRARERAFIDALDKSVPIIRTLLDWDHAGGNDGGIER